MPSWVSKKAPCRHLVKVIDREPQITVEVTAFPAEPRYEGCRMQLTPKEFGEKYERSH